MGELRLEDRPARQRSRGKLMMKDEISNRLAKAARATLPLLIRLGDFIANEDLRCEIILEIRDALDAYDLMGAQPVYYPVRYAVRGDGDFPFEMLQYDRACPDTEHDANLIREDDDLRTVNLLCFAPEQGAHRTGSATRWESFGWCIVPREELANGL